MAIDSLRLALPLEVTPNWRDVLLEFSTSIRLIRVFRRLGKQSWLGRL